MYKNTLRVLLTTVVLTTLVGNTVFAESTSTSAKPASETSSTKEDTENTKDVGMLSVVVSTITDKLFNNDKKEETTTETPSTTPTTQSTTTTSTSTSTKTSTSSNTTTPSTVTPSLQSTAIQQPLTASNSMTSSGDYIPIAIGAPTRLPDSYDDGDTVRDSALSDVTLPASYKTSPITAVRTQSGNGPCWAFSEAAGLEQSAIIHQAAPSSIVLDEAYIFNKMYDPAPDQFGLTAPDKTQCDDVNMGSNHIFTVWELASATVPTRKGSTTPAYTVVDSEFIYINESEKIKQAIIANGYVEIGIHFDSSNTGMYKYGSGAGLDHSILLLGWDDNIPASNFAVTGAGTPSKNGAWYFKDSGKFTETGFGWLSYMDPAMSDLQYNRAFTSKVGSYPQYANLYQYDGTYSYDTLAAKSFTNIFKMQSGADEEEVKAVGIGSATTGTYTIDVGVYNSADGSGTPISSTSQDIHFDNWGYKIFPLTKSLKASKGQYVLVKAYHKSGQSITLCVDSEKTFGSSGKQVRFLPAAADGQFLIDGKSYSTAGNHTPRIKLFTNSSTPVIDPRTSLSEATMTVASDVLIFDGSEKKPNVTVRIGETTLVENTDYTLQYENNINAGTATVTATAVPASTKYKGSKITIFNINQATMANVTQTGTTSVTVGTTYENAARKAVLKLNDYTLVYGTDYVATTPATAVGLGTTTIAVKGLDNFSGTMNINITTGSSPDPSKIDISTATVTSIEDQKYTGRPITLDSTQLIVRVGASVLVPDVDYKVTYLNNVNPGTATAIITGLDGYTGEKTIQFKIVGTGPTPTPPDPEDPDELIHAKSHPYLSESYKVLAVGKSFTLKAPGAKYSTVWSMTDPTVAKVNTSGKVTAVSPGICYIYAYSNNELYMPCKVVVQ